MTRLGFSNANTTELQMTSPNKPVELHRTYRAKGNTYRDVVEGRPKNLATEMKKKVPLLHGSTNDPKKILRNDHDDDNIACI